MWVSLPVCEHISGTTRPNFANVVCGRARSSSDGVAMCYVFPVSWMFSYNVLYGGMSVQLRRHRCSVMRRLTPLLRGVGRVPS